MDGVVVLFFCNHSPENSGCLPRRAKEARTGLIPLIKRPGMRVFTCASRYDCYLARNRNQEVAFCEKHETDPGMISISNKRGLLHGALTSSTNAAVV